MTAGSTRTFFSLSFAIGTENEQKTIEKRVSHPKRKKGEEREMRGGGREGDFGVACIPFIFGPNIPFPVNLCGLYPFTLMFDIPESPFF